MPNRRLLEVRVSYVHVLVATVLASIVALGVGCDDKKSASTATPQTNPIHQGNQANQSTASIEGWQDATPPADLDATQACALFHRALCERKNECGITSDDCAKAMANCPDALFAPGSTREPQSTWKCAFEIRGYRCEELYLRKNPACVSGGSRKIGEACVFPAQCESLACDGSPTACGKCLPRLGKNQSCLNAEGRPIAACEPGLTCSTESKTCVDAPAKSFAAVDGAGLSADETCVPARDACAEGLYCFDAEGVGTGTCTARIAEDQPCTTSMACEEGTYCYQEGGTCRKFPEIGKRCGNDVETGNAFHCTKDAYCNVETHLCTELPVAGEPCAATLLSGGFNVCAPSAICDATSSPPLCKALGTPGDRCGGDEECQTGLRCQCGQPKPDSPDADAGVPLDGSVLEESDASDVLDVDWEPRGRDEQASSEGSECTRVCALIQTAGKSCANPGENCDAASTCKDGTCRSNPSHALHASVCGS